MKKVYVSITRNTEDNDLSYYLHKHPLWRKKSSQLPSHISINTSFQLGIPPNEYNSRFSTTPIVSKDFRRLDDNIFTPHEMMKYGKNLFYPFHDQQIFVTHVLYRNRFDTMDYIEMSMDDFLVHICSKEIDYDFLDSLCFSFREELIEKTWHPSRLPWILSFSQNELF